MIVVTRVPDIVVTLAMSLRLGGLRAARAQDAGRRLRRSGSRSSSSGRSATSGSRKAAVVLVVIVAVIWIPLRRSRLGLSLYAIGSNRLAAFRSGVSVGRTKILAYAADGPVRRARRPVADGEHRASGRPVPGPYTLHERRGGRPRRRQPRRRPRRRLRARSSAVVILQLIRTDMTFLNVNPNLAMVIQGVILIGVVMIGSLVQIRRARA